MVINPIVGVYIPIIRIPIKGGLTIPNIATFDHDTYDDWISLEPFPYFCCLLNLSRPEGMDLMVRTAWIARWTSTALRLGMATWRRMNIPFLAHPTQVGLGWRQLPGGHDDCRMKICCVCLCMPFWRILPIRRTHKICLEPLFKKCASNGTSETEQVQYLFRVEQSMILPCRIYPRIHLKSRCTYQTEMLCIGCLNAYLTLWTELAVPGRNYNQGVNQYLWLRSLPQGIKMTSSKYQTKTWLALKVKTSHTSRIQPFNPRW